MENEIYDFLRSFYFKESNMKELIGTKIIPVNTKCMINNKHFIRHKNITDNVAINIESISSEMNTEYTFNNLSLSIHYDKESSLYSTNEVSLVWFNDYLSNQEEYYIKNIILTFDYESETGEFTIVVKVLDDNEKDICDSYITGYLGFENLFQTISISYNYNTRNYYLEDVDFTKWKEELLSLEE